MKLDKQDKKILIWGFIIGTILNFFIDKAIDSVIMLGVLYFIHKYVDVNKYTENIEFINKEQIGVDTERSEKNCYISADFESVEEDIQYDKSKNTEEIQNYPCDEPLSFFSYFRS